MDLNQVTPEKDLGITFQDDFQFTKHLADKVKKANSMLGLIPIHRQRDAYTPLHGNIRLTTLDLPTLQFRRADMLQVFKILTGYEDIDSSRFFTLSLTGLRDHSLKRFKERSRLLLRKQTFTQRVVDSWNNLPDNVVNAPSINVLKSRFNTHTRGAASKFCPTWYIPTIHIQRPQMRTRAN